MKQSIEKTGQGVSIPPPSPLIPHLSSLRSGFTILELLVASLLLSMLVTMLTMIFNQSSIAWNTGVANVNDLEEVRTKLGGYHETFDDALPGIGQNNAQTGQSDNREIKYRSVSLFKGWKGSTLQGLPRKDNNCQNRSFDQIDWTATGKNYDTGINDVRRGVQDTSLGDSDRQNKGIGGFVVGVRSSGPDRQMGTDDDINTFPEDVN